MEGPTPVSALIHAATMVTAGIYLVARSNRDLPAVAKLRCAWSRLSAPSPRFIGASIALTQNDIKRVVAYSTVSQLGYMALALGTGAWVAAIFHLMTHAFFKGLLFLGCGSVIHGMHERAGHAEDGRPAQVHADHLLDLPDWLRSPMPASFPFAGFWSKDEIIVGAWVERCPPTLGQGDRR